MNFATYSIYLIYPILFLLFCWGLSPAPRKQLYENHFSLDQTKSLQGLAAFVIMLHHAAQKTCASWIPPLVIRHGLDAFLEVGYVLVGFFFFCSGYGLYKSAVSKDGYLKIRNFFCKRVWPVVAAFYVTMLIFLAARLWRGQHIKQPQLIGYITGAMLCNKNAWYCITIVILYLVFWISFSISSPRTHRHFPVALVWVGTLAYLLAGCFIDHNDWWFCGEWWYNSVLLFPLGMSWASHEKTITEKLKKGYWIWLLSSIVILWACITISHWVVGSFGYYGDTWNQPVAAKVQSRFISAIAQNIVAFAFCFLMYVFCMKFKTGNLVIRWLGSVTLEFYLIHGLFIELFGFNFLDVTRPLKYIKNVGVYVVVVLACSVLATVILQGILHPKQTLKKIMQKTVKN